MTVSPKDAADDIIQRARAFLNLAASHSGVLGDDLVRMALVTGVAALDTYMHTLVLRSTGPGSGSLPKSLRKLDVDLGGMADLADAVVSKQRQVAAEKGSFSMRPWVTVKRVLKERLLTETFQSYDAVGNAMAMAGVAKAWSLVAQQLGCTAEDIKRRLNPIVHRRNRIVHEGDLRRLERPRKVEHTEIDAAEVLGDVDWLAKLLDAIAVVAP